MPISILKKVFRINQRDDVPHRIYGTVVAQARNSALYTDFSIADTAMGRYDMLALHVFLFNRRLKLAENGDKDQASALSQKVFDLFLADIERGLRDLGFADTTVHKRKKRLAHSYYALINEFDKSLGIGKVGTMTTSIAKRYFDKETDNEQKQSAMDLEAYMFQVARFLATQSSQAILRGKLNWPLIVKQSVGKVRDD
ncbi:MAG: hypothetical protein GY742_10520 [Hyphomicrobiales bacterium]|nr:hypothetical protein [Hyphomicrobiales bacterium]